MNIQQERHVVGYNRYRSRLVDGHTHTELCPHGSGDRTALMIEKAIECRIEKICLTEHAPLPANFIQEYIGDATALQTAALQHNQGEIRQFSGESGAPQPLQDDKGSGENHREDSTWRSRCGSRHTQAAFKGHKIQGPWTHSRG